MRSLLVVLAAGLIGCASTAPDPALAPPGAPGPVPTESELYADTANWLCHPDLPAAADICRQPLDATVVRADGSTEVVPHEPAADPPVDCFYVYPTVSRDEAGNADLVAGDEERYTTWVQAGRYSAACRLFAPLYRQTTFASIFNPAVTGDDALAYSDVLDAFQHYLATEAHGRGFVLVGHSQGARHLRRLIAEVVEKDPVLLDRLVAAHLIGYTVAVPEGALVGGSFDRVPACTAPDETGCVVSYATYRRGDPDLASGAALFGRTSGRVDDMALGDGFEALCVNPGALSGGPATLTPFFPSRRPEAFAGLIASAGIFVDDARDSEIATPFYTTPGVVRAECQSSGGVRYLEAVADLDEGDARESFGGELLIVPGWGLHFVDMTLAQGTLVDLAGRQAQAWSASR